MLLLFVASIAVSMAKKFIRTKEDFVCEKCGFMVIGDGFTNHCPKCLYSKHVDINPGDRQSKCQGLMAPIAIEGTQKKYFILHKCIVCGFEKRNKVVDSDSFDAVTEIARKRKV